MQMEDLNKEIASITWNENDCCNTVIEVSLLSRYNITYLEWWYRKLQSNLFFVSEILHCCKIVEIF
jgi:hypothetical protein